MGYLEFRISLLIGAALATLCTTNVTMSADGAQVTIPIRIAETSPIIEVRVNGMPINVLFDIGRSGNVSLFPAVFEQIDKVQIGESVGGVSMDGPTGGGRPIYRVDVVQVGDIGFTNVSMGEDFHDAEFQADFIARKDAYGFAGTGLFKNHKIVIDYQRRELTLIASDVPLDQQSACRGKEIPLITGLDWGLVTKASTEIGDIVLVWDTGAPGNLIFKKRTDTANLNLAEYDALTLKKLAFDEHEFGPMEFFVRDLSGPPFDGFIGYSFFMDHIVCVDFPGNRLLIRQ